MIVLSDFAAVDEFVLLANALERFSGRGNTSFDSDEPNTAHKGTTIMQPPITAERHLVD